MQFLENILNVESTLEITENDECDLNVIIAPNFTNISQHFVLTGENLILL